MAQASRPAIASFPTNGLSCSRKRSSRKAGPDSRPLPLDHGDLTIGPG
ncbi:hypothetical protein V5785_22480 [Bacillus subtilis]